MAGSMPSNAQGPDLTLAVVAACERPAGRRLSMAGLMAWGVLTGRPSGAPKPEVVPEGGTAPTYVAVQSTWLRWSSRSERGNGGAIQHPSVP